jgi:hypothetical protein
MRSTIWFLLFVLVAARGFGAASAETEMEQLRQIGAEVAARKIVREHESGRKKATEEQLASARAVIRKGQERKAREVAPSPNGGFSLTMRDADVATIAKMWQEVFGGIVTAADRIKSKKVSLSASDSSFDDFQKKLEAELRRNGIYFIYRPDGLILDSEPDSYRRK